MSDLKSDYIDAPAAPSPRHPRLLKGKEIVRVGDFVEDEKKPGFFVPWVGPAGFQADAFVKPVYRAGGRRARPLAVAS